MTGYSQAGQELDCYLCGRFGVRGFVLNRWGKWTGYYRCANENACALRIYRRNKAGA